MRPDPRSLDSVSLQSHIHTYPSTLSHLGSSNAATLMLTCWNFCWDLYDDRFLLFYVIKDDLECMQPGINRVYKSICD